MSTLERRTLEAHRHNKQNQTKASVLVYHLLHPSTRSHTHLSTRSHTWHVKTNECTHVRVCIHCTNATHVAQKLCKQFHCNRLSLWDLNQFWSVQLDTQCCYCPLIQSYVYACVSHNFDMEKQRCIETDFKWLED